MRKKLLRAYWLGNVLTLVIVIAFAAVMIAADIDAERAKVRVMVSFFGRETPVELDFLHVEKV